MIQLSSDTYLRPLSAEDTPLIFNEIIANREYLREWLPFVDFTQEVEDTEAFVTSTLESGEKQFVIYHHEQFVGLIGFTRTDAANKRTEIGYWLAEAAQGNGIVTKAVVELLHLAFGQLDFNRVQIRVAVANTKSRNIPEKLGFCFEGIERDGELLVDNTFTDLAIYSMLKKEFGG
ncbi:GNAT family N-acetyltransferase [Dysgonomonas sp. ZJ709]|uniref:GNAT family N-acetyltransferase n=1 Tax=Dysgonomonas sp. ZJ709 TaxID=2709797 RepID=UPI0013E9D5F3|nr:GNAT family N-acetyltransferase [Dysgonomonas sp. ZJ709]